MGFFRRIFSVFRKRQEFSKEDKDVMHRLTREIPGSSIPDSVSGRKTIAHQGTGLTKPLPLSFNEQARAQKAAQQAEMAERQRLMAQGKSPSKAANILAKKRIEREHSGDKSWQHFKKK